MITLRGRMERVTAGAAGAADLNHTNNETDGKWQWTGVWSFQSMVDAPDASIPTPNKTFRKFQYTFVEPQLAHTVLVPSASIVSQDDDDDDDDDDKNEQPTPIMVDSVTVDRTKSLATISTSTTPTALTIKNESISSNPPLLEPIKNATTVAVSADDAADTQAKSLLSTPTETETATETATATDPTKDSKDENKEENNAPKETNVTTTLTPNENITFASPPYTDASGMSIHKQKCPPGGSWTGSFENVTKRKDRNFVRIAEQFVLFFNATPPSHARTTFLESDMDPQDTTPTTEEGRLPEGRIHVRGMGTNQFGTFEIVGSLHLETNILHCQRMYVLTTDSNTHRKKSSSTAQQQNTSPPPLQMMTRVRTRPPKKQRVDGITTTPASSATATDDTIPTQEGTTTTTTTTTRAHYSTRKRILSWKRKPQSDSDDDEAAARRAASKKQRSRSGSSGAAAATTTTPLSMDDSASFLDTPNVTSTTATTPRPSVANAIQTEGIMDNRMHRDNMSLSGIGGGQVVVGTPLTGKAPGGTTPRSGAASVSSMTGLETPRKSSVKSVLSKAAMDAAALATGSTPVLHTPSSSAKTTTPANMTQAGAHILLPVMGDLKDARWRAAHFMYYQETDPSSAAASPDSSHYLGASPNSPAAGATAAATTATIHSTGVTKSFVVYEGEMVHGKNLREGNGICLYNNGTLYQGQWRRNKEHGKGTLMTADRERIIYTGDWERGRMHGSGTYHHSDHNNNNNNNNDSDSSHDNDSTMDGRVYYCGDFKENMRHGIGKYQLPDGSMYDGEWRENVPCGRGTFVWPNDLATYVGQWRSGRRHGQGMITCQDGFSYDGMWVNNAMEGRGIAVYSGGQRYEGLWAKGKREGRGTIHFTNGAIYEGRFREDAMEGQGTMKMNRNVMIVHAKGPLPEKEDHPDPTMEQDANTTTTTTTTKDDWMIPIEFQSDMTHIHERAGFDHSGG